jgi:hypothetical protein
MQGGGKRRLVENHLPREGGGVGVGTASSMCGSGTCGSRAVEWSGGAGSKGAEVGGRRSSD